MNCIVNDTSSPCSRCGFRHPGFPNQRECKTRHELVAESQASDKLIDYSRFFAFLGLAEESSALKPRGPGTELHALLGRFGLHASGDCKCKSRVAYMDNMEAEQPGWCAANIEEIVGWLRESAAERGLPFVDIAGRVLVKRAIANARRKEAARVATEAADRPPLRPEQ